MRNEGLLKLFLSGTGTPEQVGRALEGMRRHSDDVAGRLREIEDEIGAPEGSEQLCLRFGIEMNEWISEWCKRQDAALRRKNSKRRAA